MRVLILSGSIGSESCTRTLLKYLENLLKLDGVETVFWDMAEKPLPIAIPEYHKKQHLHPEQIVRDFIKIVEKTDGFILGSPLYHGSYSGVLKNALDNLPHDAFKKRPIGLVSHSSNARSCVAPCNDLRPVIRSLDGYATHLQIGTTDEDYSHENGQLMLQNNKIKLRSSLLINELTKLCAIFAQPQ